MIQIGRIQIDGGTQPRENISEDVVSEYAEAMLDGDKFPPIVVYNDGAKYWLADGFHRYHASVKAGFKDIEADVKSGTRRDAILYSVSANAKHGIRRTNADKRKAVLTLLEDEEWRSEGIRWIARTAKVSEGLAHKMYHEHASVHDEQMKPEIRKARRGDQEYDIDTTNIGRKEKLLDDPSDYEEQDDGGYDLPDNVDPATGEVFEEKEIERTERKGIGLEKAHEAIAVLKQIPPNDDLLQEGYDIVIRWVNRNR